MEQLVLAGGGLWHLAGELDKYCTYLNEDEKVITAALSGKAIFRQAARSTFSLLTDALAEGDPPQALDMLQRLLERREEPVKIFFMLVRHYRLLLMARSLRDENIPAAEHAAAMQVHPFAARTLYRQAAAYKRNPDRRASGAAKDRPDVQNRLPRSGAGAGDRPRAAALPGKALIKIFKCW